MMTTRLPSCLSIRSLAARILNFQKDGKLVAVCDPSGAYLTGDWAAVMTAAGANVSRLLITMPDTPEHAREICDSLRRSSVVDCLFVIEEADPRIAELAAPFAFDVDFYEDGEVVWQGPAIDMLADNWPGLGVDLEAEGIIHDLLVGLNKARSAAPGEAVHVWNDITIARRAFSTSPAGAATAWLSLRADIDSRAAPTDGVTLENIMKARALLGLGE